MPQFPVDEIEEIGRKNVPVGRRLIQALAGDMQESDTRGVIHRMLTEGSDEEETRTYEMTAYPEILDALEEILGAIAYLGNVGSSRELSFSVDGDGRARLKVKRDGKEISVSVDTDKDEIRLSGLA